MTPAPDQHLGLGFDDHGTGPALVLLHGHPFDRTMWAPQLSGLSDQFRVLAVDLPGYGTSPVRASEMPMRAFADAVIDLLDALGVERAVVTGLSMGGLIAMELGLGHPERVAGLVLAATTAEPVADGEAERRLATAALAEERGMLPLAADMIATLFGPDAGRDRDLVLRIFAMMLDAPPAGAAAALRGRARRPDYTRLLPGLTVPSLVVSGSHDAHSPEAVLQQLLAALPAPELVRCRESGHLPNLEEPARFNQAVRAFTARAHDRAHIGRSQRIEDGTSA